MPKDKDRETSGAVQTVDTGEWRTLLFEVESRIDTVNSALDELRQAVIKLSALPAPPAPVAAEPPSAPAFEPFPEMQETPAVDEEAAREEVRRAVEAMRSEFHSEPVVQGEPEAVPAESADDEAAREEVRRAVEAARAELMGGEEPVADAPPADEDAAREEVRRAVEAARAELDIASTVLEEETQTEAVSETPAARRPTLTELFSPQPQQTDDDVADPAAAAADRWQARHDEGALTPAAIVIEDAQGRVELSRVYDALSRVDCASQAALLNYTPHSVTVGLGPRTTLPDGDQLRAAVESIFNLPCRVAVDGSRVTVHLGEDAAKGAA